MTALAGSYFPYQKNEITSLILFSLHKILSFFTPPFKLALPLPLHSSLLDLVRFAVSVFVPVCSRHRTADLETIWFSMANDGFQKDQQATPTIPPFLFRAASDQSRGINTAAQIHPLHGYGLAYHRNLEHLEATGLPRSKLMIENHIGYHYKVPSESSSWSV